MLTIHVSLSLIVVVLAMVSLIAISFACGLWWLFRTLRLGQFKSAVEDGSSELKRATTAAAKAVQAATAENQELVLELIQQLQTVHDGIQNLVPADMRNALHRVAMLHAKDMTEKYLDQLKEAGAKIELYQLWLRAMTGGPSDISCAARRGFPVGMPEDLAGRLEAEVSKRRGQNVNGRPQPSPFASR
jgi:hypothetical protein